jgi:thiol-disulfide isomerase/thioredoxin
MEYAFAPKNGSTKKIKKSASTQFARRKSSRAGASRDSVGERGGGDRERGVGTRAQTSSEREGCEDMRGREGGGRGGRERERKVKYDALPVGGGGGQGGGGGAVVELSDSTFLQMLEEGGSWMVMFYAPWCSGCQQAKPAFEQASVKVQKRGGGRV